MSKFSSAFGKQYEKNRVSILSRKFEMGNHTFSVRVPSVGELEAIYAIDADLFSDEVEKAFQELTKDLNFEAENMVKSDEDIVVEGRSMRLAAKNKVVLQKRITEYFKLLVPETNESLENLTYEDIEQEFPLSIQMQFVERINEVISPDYKEARGK